MPDPSTTVPDISDPAFWRQSLEDRMAAFAVLREAGPFARFTVPNVLNGEDEPFYAVTRHADVVEISRRPTTFCSGQGSISIQDIPAEAMEFFGSFIVMDDPRHARLRGIVARSFTPRKLQGVLDSVERICAEVIDGFCEQGEVDLVEALSAAVPAPGDLRHDGHPPQRVRHGPRRHERDPRRRRSRAARRT